ncbi:MAG: hypothetical protein HY286_07360 [Planctomycetes bacterium]|nr:hypothetical protein [Planctomycetota bacterium]
MKSNLLLIIFTIAPLLAVPETQDLQKKLTIDLSAMRPGAAPAGFTIEQTGPGAPPAFAVVEDAGAPGGRAIEQTTTDETGGRYPICVFDGASARDVCVSAAFKPIAGQVDRAAGLVARYRNRDNYYLVRANALEDNIRLYRVVGGKRIQFAGLDHKLIKEVVWHSLKMEIRGRHFRVWYDDELLYEADDDTFPDAGRAGLWTKADSVTRFAQFTLEPPPGARAFDFENAATGGLPPGFTSMVLGEAPPSMAWTIANDPTSPRGRNILTTKKIAPPAASEIPASAPSTAARPALALLEDGVRAKNAAVSVYFKTLSGESEQRVAGLVARYKDKNNYYIARVNTREDNIQLHRVAQGKRKLIGEIHHKIVTEGEWHSLELAVKGKVLQVSCDGLLQFEATDDGLMEPGQFGIWCAQGCVTNFDGYAVEVF